MTGRNLDEFNYCQSDNRVSLLVLLGLTVASGIIVAMLISFATVASSERDRYLIRLIENTADYLRAASALRLNHSVADYEAVFGPMVEEGVLAGALILDNRGGVIKFLGDIPSIDLRERLDNPGAYHRAEDGCCIDVFFGKAETRFDHDVELRIPIFVRNRGGFDAFQYWVWFALMGATIGILITIAGSFVLVAQPVHAFNLSLGKMIHGRAEARVFANTNPTISRSIPARDGDFVPSAKPWGKFAKSLHRFQAELSAVLPSKTEEFSQALEMLPNEFLMFDETGQLLAANEAALWLYKAKNLNELQRRGLCRFERASELVPSPRGILELLGEGTLDFDAIIFVGQDGEKRRLVAREMHNDKGGRLGYSVALLNSQLCDEVRANNPEPPLNRQSSILKLQLEACLTLLKTHDSKKLQSKSQPVRCDLIVESWFLAMADSGLIGDDMTHDLPMQLIGDYDAVECLLRLALTVVALRSQTHTPSLKATGSLVTEGKIQFIFEEVGGAKLPAVSNAPSDLAETEDWKLSLAALSRLLRAYGGKVAALRGTEDVNLVRMVLPSRGKRAGNQEAGPHKSAA